MDRRGDTEIAWDLTMAYTCLGALPPHQRRGTYLYH